MIKKFIAPVLLALGSLLLLYLNSMNGDYASLNFSIAVIMCMGSSGLAAFMLLILYLAKRQYTGSFSIYITVLLIGSFVGYYFLVDPRNIFHFLFSTVGVVSLLLIGFMLFVIIIQNLPRSGKGPGRKV
jgi:hypothetical protein